MFTYKYSLDKINIEKEKLHKKPLLNTMAFLLDTLIPYLKEKKVITNSVNDTDSVIQTKHWDLFLFEHDTLDIVVHHDGYGMMSVYTMKKIDTPHDIRFISAFGDYTKLYDSDYDYDKWVEIIERLKYYEFNIFTLEVEVPESVYVKESVFYGDLQNKLSKEDFELVKIQFDNYRNKVYIGDDEKLKDNIVASLDSFLKNIFDMIASNDANRENINNPYVTNNIEHDYNKYINVNKCVSFADFLEQNLENTMPLYDLSIDRNYL